MKVSKQVLKNLKEEIQKNLFEYFKDSTNRINNGGCCYFSHIIAKELEKRNLPFKVKFYLDEEDIYECSPYKFFKQSANFINGESCCHIVIFCNGVELDAYNSKIPYLESILDTYHSKQLLNIYNNGDWNDVFKDTFSNKDINKIKSIVKNTFKKYDKDLS